MKPLNFAKFYLFFMFTYLKNFVVPDLKVKKFKFWRAHSEETPIVKPPFFVAFSLFLIFTYSEILILLALKV